MNDKFRQIYGYRSDVVVVEDDPVIRTLIVDILTDIGATAVAFETADDALEHVLESHAICPLVIVDHGLPGRLLGTRFAEMVKVKWPNVALLITSGYELPLTTLPPGAAYIQKPWTVDQFERMTLELLR
ncbi:response regulator [Pseudomonas sp. NA-150]|uniref:response regulator n=1 Tax=Pseudomonas sp. NA-150 TaxID=3367525 RepID=UPI0037CB9EA8